MSGVKESKPANKRSSCFKNSKFVSYDTNFSYFSYAECVYYNLLPLCPVLNNTRHSSSAQLHYTDTTPIRNNPTMSIAPPFPLYPTFQELKDFNWADFSELQTALEALPEWSRIQWEWGKQFLLYLGRNKSDNTFVRFRSDIEKFLLWSFLVVQKPIDQLKKSDVLEFSEFFFKPPPNWIGLSNVDKFLRVAGNHRFNPEWHPFRYITDGEDVDTRKYRPSQQSILAMFAAVIALYKYLMDEELCLGNPAQIAKKDCKRLIKDCQVREMRRLDQDQWDFLLDTARQMADEDALLERNLFLVAAMKTLFLRISELSEREGWTPVMSHFWQDDDKSWWLKIYGKGRKLRDVSVPHDFLPYLERYRLSRRLSELPGRHDKQAVIEKIRGSGGMTGRQLARLVEQVLTRAYERMLAQSGKKAAQVFKDVSPHWLRHTGASMEIERGRPLKDVSEDLGHSSMATTDTVYVQTSARKRAESGNKRPV
jgi:site-specific recombinase XerD